MLAIFQSVISANGTSSSARIVNAPLGIPTTVMHALVLTAIWKSRTLHCPSYILFFGLALSDLGVGLLAQPENVIYTVAKM